MRAPTQLASIKSTTTAPRSLRSSRSLPLSLVIRLDRLDSLHPLYTRGLRAPSELVSFFSFQVDPRPSSSAAQVAPYFHPSLSIYLRHRRLLNVIWPPESSAQPTAKRAYFSHSSRAIHYIDDSPHAVTYNLSLPLQPPQWRLGSFIHIYRFLYSARLSCGCLASCWLSLGVNEPSSHSIRTIHIYTYIFCI